MRTFKHYDIAYKRVEEKCYRLVTPPKYGWIADPFLVEFQGKLLLFAEIFLYKSERNGVIGYCEYNGDSFGKWEITMDKHWHLSYPNVFTKNDKLYMIPESYQLGEVVLYELIEFPDKWKKVKSYISDVEYCDTTLLEYKDGGQYMFTFERIPDTASGKGLLFQIENGELRNKRYLFEGLQGVRCGGKIIQEKDRYIRVGQDSLGEYGAGIIFYQIDSVWPKYEEHEVGRLSPKDIKVDSDRHYIGLHTYNVLNDLEVIDLKYVTSSEEEEEASERTRKVFLNKYI